MKWTYNRLITLGALVALAGFILSGPVAFMFIRWLAPQPQWVSAAVFAENYSTLQDLPYYFGFLLVGGMLMLSAGHYLNFSEEHQGIKFHLLLSFGWTVVFCTLISFNYVCQTTFVHNLALNYSPEHDVAITTFSMVNPLSFCWANEMWGYAFLGIATLLMSGYYSHTRTFIQSLLITNGIVSLIGVLWTIVDVHWVMTTTGLIAYFAWNILMIVILILIFLNSNKNKTSLYMQT